MLRERIDRLGDDEVIQHAYIDESQSLFQSPGDEFICPTGLGEA